MFDVHLHFYKTLTKNNVPFIYPLMFRQTNGEIISTAVEFSNEIFEHFENLWLEDRMRQ